LIAGAIGGGKAGEIDPATLERFRTMLNLRRERYPLAAVMQRLAAARKNEDQFEWLAPPQGEDPTVPRAEWAAQEDELVVEIANCGPLQPCSAPKPSVGRPPADHERYIALLVGVVFHEYTLRSPTRIWDHDHRAEYNSPFYKFAEAVFLWLGLAPSWQAFREVSERWDNSQEFSKPAIKVLLFGDRGNEDGPASPRIMQRQSAQPTLEGAPRPRRARFRAGATRGLSNRGRTPPPGG
jgi:hypothetical protein